MDPLMISTALLGVSTIVLGAGYIGRGKQIDRWMAENDTLSGTIAFQQKELRDFREKERDRREKLRAAGAKGKLVQLAKVAETRAERKAAVKEARSATLDAVSGTKFRSRAQVVAPIKAKRTRAQNKSTGAEVAAKTRG